MKVYTMISRVSETDMIGDNDILTLVDENYLVAKQQASSVMRAMQRKLITVTNLGIQSGKLIGTNGSIKNYPCMVGSTGEVKNSSVGVILNRAEVDGRLVGYTITDAMGIVRELSVQDTLNFYNTFGIANGKIKHTQSGDIISAIKGNFIVRSIKIDSDTPYKCTIEPLYISTYYNKDNSKAGKVPFAGIIVDSQDLKAISKLYSRFGKEIELVKAKVEQLGFKDVKIWNARVGETAILMIVPLETYLHILKMKDCILVTPKMCNGKVPISVLAVDKEGDTFESIVMLDCNRSDKKIVYPNDSIEGAETSVKMLKKFAEYMKKEMDGIEVHSNDRN